MAAVVLAVVVLAVVVLTIVVGIVLAIVVLTVVLSIVIIGGNVITAASTVVGPPTKQIVEEPQNTNINLLVNEYRISFQTQPSLKKLLGCKSQT